MGEAGARQDMRWFPLPVNSCGSRQEEKEKERKTHLCPG